MCVDELPIINATSLFINCELSEFDFSAHENISPRKKRCGGSLPECLIGYRRWARYVHVGGQQDLFFSTCRISFAFLFSWSINLMRKSFLFFTFEHINVFFATNGRGEWKRREIEHVSIVELSCIRQKKIQFCGDTTQLSAINFKCRSRLGRRQSPYRSTNHWEIDAICSFVYSKW